MNEPMQEGDRFVIRDNGRMVAEITFVSKGDDTLVIDHTYVEPEMRGQKLAERLVQSVVEHARNE